MTKRINKAQILASLSLSFILGIAAIPTATYATDGAVVASLDQTNDEGVAPASTDQTGNPTESWKKTTATGAEILSLGRDIDKISNYTLMSGIVYQVEYLRSGTCAKFEANCPNLRSNIVNAMPSGSDMTGWDQKSFYEIVPLAKASADYNTNTVLQKAVGEAESMIDDLQLNLITNLHYIGAGTVSDLKTKTVAELVTMAEALPKYAQYDTLELAKRQATAYVAGLTNENEATAENAKYYNDLYTAALAVDAAFVATPTNLPDTSVNTPTDDKTNTKAPNTGIFGDGENKTAIAAVGGLIVVAAASMIIAARKTLKRKVQKIRKF